MSRCLPQYGDLFRQDFLAGRMDIMRQNLGSPGYPGPGTLIL
jgi:hypothetical protein